MPLYFWISIGAVVYFALLALVLRFFAFAHSYDEDIAEMSAHKPPEHPFMTDEQFARIKDHLQLRGWSVEPSGPDLYKVTELWERKPKPNA